jgi:hypothetical protein
VSEFAIEDEFHGEIIGRFAHIEDAQRELRRIATVPWGTQPNAPPCGNLDCQRDYRILDYVDGAERVHGVLQVPAKGVTRGDNA